MSYTVGSTRVINTTSSSGTTEFTFTFPYIKEAHIEVYKDYTKLTQATGDVIGANEYKVITNVSPTLIRLGTATASANVRLEIRRNSSLNTPLVDYADGSTLTAKDLDTSALQSLYIDQELKDSQFQTVSISATTGLPTLNNNPLTEVADPTNAQDAATKNYVDTNDALKLAKAGDSMTGVLAMGTNKVTGVGDPTAAQDAATKSYVDALSTGGLDSRYYTETELNAGQLDNRYYTETESDARYFNVSTGDTIKDGDAFPDNDTTIATTAAINDRIVDLVDDVGGFVPIANETSFPTTNPDVNDGTGTLVSIKAFAASHTPSGGTVTIANGAGSGNTVTITGCGTTVLAADYGGIVETTATLHTYSFHRLVPKATEVTSVATNVSPNITNINTVANNISDVNNFADLYQIASSAPSADGGGNALADGDLYFNTTNNELQVYNGSAWQGGVTPSSDLMPKSGGTFTGSINFNDDVYARFGNDLDLEVYHATGVPGHTYVKHNGTANFTIDKTGTSGNIDIKFGSDSAASFIKDGAVELFHGGTKKIETTSAGVTVSGVATVGGLVLDDGEIIKLGASQDLQIYHENTSHTTRLQAYADRVIDICYNETSSGLVKSFVQCYPSSGSVVINHASVSKLTTTSTGISVTGNVDLTGSIGLADSEKVTFGTGSDLQIYHDGTNSYLENSTGHLYIRNDSSSTTEKIIIQAKSGEGGILVNANGNVELYYDDVKKLETVTGGATVTGTISAGAASFTDDGSAGPVINISGDDSSIWYGRIGNESYHDNVNTGFKFYVSNGGDATFYHQGNAEYRNWLIGSYDGTTYKTDIYKVASSGNLALYHDGNIRLQTTTAGVSVTGTVTDSTGELRTIVQNTQAGAYTLVAADAGKHILASGNITVPDSVFSAGQAITIVNNTASDLTITKGTTLYNTADGSNANRTLATRGMATLLFTAADTAYISGAGLS